MTMTLRSVILFSLLGGWISSVVSGVSFVKSFLKVIGCIVFAISYLRPV